ncbi:hypothetical protein [Brevibacterium sp. K72]|uniref:hypothetical protein n=1 Tax=Brevibacterium sp. K72 TaxID=3390729 RepID=UPI003D3013F3
MGEKKYTAEDFAVVEFAKHRDGSQAARMDPGDSLPWRIVCGQRSMSWFNDYDMAEGGWVPVPSSPAKHTITESEFREALGRPRTGGRTERTLAILGELGVAVVPDPEPTNAERLADDLMQADRDGGQPYRGGDCPALTWFTGL